MEHPFVREVKKSLALSKGSWIEIAETAGVSHSWISQFTRGLISNPGIENLQRVLAASEDVVAARKRRPERRAAA
jgi:transcriptional regulator with XRE-family HTH domain